MDNEQLVARIQGGENTAENMLALWQQNRAFITMIARKYAGGVEMDDLEQEGYIGLCSAVQHYNSERGMSFMNYAAFWIMRCMRKCVNNNRAVRLPFHAEDEVKRYRKIVREYKQKYACDPSEWEIGDLMGISREKLRQIQKAAQMGNMRSLNEPAQEYEGGDVPFVDLVGADEDMETDVIEKLDREHMMRELWVAVDRLSGKQPEVIRSIYQKGMTRKEAGERSGISMYKAREIEHKAIRILRQPHRNKKFRCYCEEYFSVAPIHHVGVQRFRETWTSTVELAAIEHEQANKKGGKKR